MNTKQQLTVYRLFRSVLPIRQVSQIVKLLEFYQKTHGLKFVVSRMKILSLELVGKPSSTIAKDRKGYWKGPFKPFHRRAKESRRMLRRCLNVLKFIGIFRAKVTRDTFKRHQQILDSVPLTQVPYVKPPVIHGTFRRGPFLGHYASWSELSSMAAIVFKHYDQFKEFPVLPKVMYLNKELPIVGSCHCLVDDGALKTRFVYSPWVALQYVLEPLYYGLKQYCDTLPSMYHRDQELGRHRVHELMLDQYCYSADLHQATDFLPAIAQFTMLRALLPDLVGLTNLAEDVSFSAWYTPHGLIQHHVGQPMGLKFSFLLFSLYLYLLLKEEFDERSFALLGDDIVVPESGYNYLRDLGFTLSETKTVGGDYNEFAGTIITHDGDLGISRFKHAKDALSIVDRFGKAGYRFLSRSYRKKVKEVVNLPPPVGLGWKPRSIDRVSPATVYELYRTKPVSNIPPMFPRTSQSYLRDWEYLLEPGRPTPQERRRHDKYVKLIEAQSFSQAGKLNCMLEGLEDAFEFISKEWVLHWVYGISTYWRSTVEYPIALPHPFSFKRLKDKGSVNEVNKRLNTMYSTIHPGKVSQGNLKKASGLAVRTKVSGGNWTVEYNSLIDPEQVNALWITTKGIGISGYNKDGSLGAIDLVPRE